MTDRRPTQRKPMGKRAGPRRGGRRDAVRKPSANLPYPSIALLRGILESVPFPMYVIDVHTHRIVLANAATCRGNLPEDATCYALTHHRSSPCEGPDSLCPIDDLRQTGKAAVLEHVHYDRYGVAKRFEVNAFPVFGRGGNISHVVEYNVDVTERRRVEEELRTHERSLEMLVQELKRSNEELKAFTSVAAHDIRAPMAKIASAAELLEESLPRTLPDDARAALDILVKGVNRMTQLVGSLYRCSQVGAGEWLPRKIDLNRVVAELKDLQLARDLDMSHGTILVPEPLHTVRGDESQIVELMQNLIANGLKYHRKGLLPTVTIRSWEADGNRIRIEVSDNGIGIRPADQEKVFGMFERLQEARDREGLGIGLAFCRRVVDRHGGRIGVRSRYGEGSTFWVELPR